MKKPEDVKIWVYAVCWNEEQIIPFFLAHYSLFADRIIIYDNGSTDQSLSLLAAHPLVEIRHFQTQGENNELIKTKIKNLNWKEARNQADYVIITDMDEFFLTISINIKEFLIQNQQYSVFKPFGINMVSPNFPNPNQPIYNQIQTGVPEPGWQKMGLFDPNKNHRHQL